MSARALLLVVVATACAGGPRGRLAPAGSDRDDGYGDLAEASVHLRVGGPAAPLPPHEPPRARRRGADSEPPAESDDDLVPARGAAEGCRGLARGCIRPTVAAKYATVAGLAGAVEGAVRWRRPPPRALATACGTIEPPGLHLGPARAAVGVLVYVERVSLGRDTPSYDGPASVGGTIAKRGCTLTPALQIVSPLPAELEIHGDAVPTTLRVTPPAGSRKLELQEAGRVVVEAQPGVTRIEAADGSLTAAWVIAPDSPYFALTDEQGRFRIDELAPGTYDLAVMRPGFARRAGDKLAYGDPVVIRRKITVDETRPTRLELTIE